MAKVVEGKGWSNEKAFPKIGRKWGRLLFYKSRYGIVVRTVSNQISNKQMQVISGWSQWLKWMNVIWKYVHPEVKLEFLRLEKISGIPARDLFISSANGLLWYFELEDGRRIYSMAHRERISRSLDVFSQVRGSLLVRGDEVWEGLLPGPDGYILGMSEGRPKWLPGGGGKVSSFFFPCRLLDGQWGWSGIGAEGIYIVRFDKNSYHYVRAPLQNISGEVRLTFSFSVGFLSNVRGDCLMRGTVFVRKKESFEELGRSEAIFNVDGGYNPGYVWRFSFVVNIGTDVLFPIVELARVGDDVRDTCNGDLYLLWLNVSVS